MKAELASIAGEYRKPRRRCLRSEVEKRVEGHCWHQSVPAAQKNGCGKWKQAAKRLAKLWSRKKITKTARAGRGQEPIWEIPKIPIKMRRTKITLGQLESFLFAAADKLRGKMDAIEMAPCRGRKLNWDEPRPLSHEP